MLLVVWLYYRPNSVLLFIYCVLCDLFLVELIAIFWNKFIYLFAVSSKIYTNYYIKVESIYKQLIKSLPYLFLSSS